jgi:cytochrome c peroxidase
LPATGGPVNLSRIGLQNIPEFEVPFAFTQYEGWATSSNAAQSSINRGETIFDTTTFTINGVAGFNNVVSTVVPVPGPVTATCSTCHNNLDVGADTINGGRHLGIGDNSSVDKTGPQATATALPPTSDQPLFAFDCPVGSIPYFSNPVTVNGKTYDEYQTTDPGMGLISGSCADLGKFKVPRLDGLASRAPYFHNGNAASLSQLVDFYNTRFSIGLSAQDKQDLINFLNSL